MKPAYTRRSNANSKAQANMTHPGTINAIQTCNAAIHGPWKHLTKLQIKYKEHHKKQEQNIIWAYIYIWVNWNIHHHYNESNDWKWMKMTKKRQTWSLPRSPTMTNMEQCCLATPFSIKMRIRLSTFIRLLGLLPFLLSSSMMINCSVSLSQSLCEYTSLLVAPSLSVWSALQPKIIRFFIMESKVWLLSHVKRSKVNLQEDTVEKQKEGAG